MADDIEPTGAPTAAAPSGPPAPPAPLRLHTSDGVALEAELRVPADATAAVVLTHPHPLFGGSMRSLVTSELFRVLSERGVATLRFNFRGVEGSAGAHGGGRDERLDVLAAMGALVDAVTSSPDAAAPAPPLVLCGWSFGADVALSITDPRLSGWFLIAPPLRVLPFDELVAGPDPRPKCFAVPEHDQYRGPDDVRAASAGWPATEVHTVPGADHFLVGRTALVADLVTQFVLGLRPAAR